MFRQQVRWSSKLSAMSRMAAQRSPKPAKLGPLLSPPGAVKVETDAPRSAKSAKPFQRPVSERADKPTRRINDRSNKPNVRTTNRPASMSARPQPVLTDTNHARSNSAPPNNQKKSFKSNKISQKDEIKKSLLVEEVEVAPIPAFKRPAKVKVTSAKKPTIAIPKFISIANFAHMLKKRLPALQATMSELGFTELGHDHVIDAETAGLIADELGYEVVVNEIQGEDIFPAPEVPDAPLRPPMVTIMGHVDHGKTTILDYLRKSSIAAGEHGGITQHIGAFAVHVGGKQICFLDTPGHAAFLNMRQRGANITDIVILVVAADDAVMPQTKEAIKHAQNAGVPMIVAINKCDLPDADVEHVISELAANNVDVEPYGGETQVIPVSGLKGTNIDKLEEAILTLSEILELRAPMTGSAEGWIIESEVKKGVGNAATVLVRRGTLKPGGSIVAGTKWCKVKSLTDDRGKRMKQAGPGTPVEVLGWKELPEAGDEVFEAKNEAHAKRVVENRLERESQLQLEKDIEVLNEKRKQHHELASKQAEREERIRRGLAPEDQKTTAESEEVQKEVMQFIVKADVSGSAEAVRDCIQGLGNADIEVSVLYSGVGAVTESDVVRAESANATLLTFNLPKLSKDVALAVARKKVDLVEHSIIYRLLEDVTARLTAQLKPEIKHKVLGEALIKDIFDITVKKTTKKVAGCRVTNGVLGRNAKVKVLRNREEIYVGAFNSMKHHKEEVMEAKKDSECGLAFDKWTAFEAGDIIQTYEEIAIPRHL